MRDATQAQLDFMATELPRFEAIGAWERGHCNKWVSRMFLVPKPGTNKWRLIIDLRELNKWCKTFTMSYETLKHLRHLARAGDWFVSMDLADGYYALGIREEDRDFFTVNYRGELWRLACLPMGWTGSSYYFCKLTAAFTDYLRTPLKRRDPALPPTAPSKPTRRFLRNTRWRGERLLPYMDDFLFLADSREAALELRVRLSTLLDRLGLLRNPNKGVWEPTQVGPHLGLIIDLKRGEFRAPEEKLIALAKAARSLLGRAASNKRWLPARQLASFAGKAQFLYLAVTPARFFLRELHGSLLPPFLRRQPAAQVLEHLPAGVFRHLVGFSHSYRVVAGSLPGGRRPTSHRFQVDIAQFTQGCRFRSKMRRRPLAGHQTHGRLVEEQRGGHREVHRPDHAPDSCGLEVLRLARPRPAAGLSFLC
eukprot:jgi/Tetstr1/459710/TSEL_005063.t1